VARRVGGAEGCHGNFCEISFLCMPEGGEGRRHVTALFDLTSMELMVMEAGDDGDRDYWPASLLLSEWLGETVTFRGVEVLD
jgi:hypothetical protein